LETSFGGVGYGNKLLGVKDKVNQIYKDKLDLWQNVMFSPNRITIAALGVK
jgi:hypothetical protein